MSMTPLTRQAEDLDHINNILQALHNNNKNKMLYREQKKEELEKLNNDILNGTLPYMLADSGPPQVVAR